MLVFLIGASGVGKTTVAELLAERHPWAGHVHHFDTIGVPSPDEMALRFGGGEAWQEWATGQWVERLVGSTAPLQLLEGQTRPSFIDEALSAHRDVQRHIVLLDCSRAARRTRLHGPRNAPHLDTPEMDAWAAYLVAQARALELPVIDTSDLSPSDTSAAIERRTGVA